MNLRLLSRLVLSLVAIITVLAALQISKLRFDYDFNKFFPQKDPSREVYLQHAQQFGNDNDYLLIGLEHQPSIFDSTFLARVDSLTSYVRLLPNVVQVLSPTTASFPVVEPFGLFQVPYLHVHEPDRYADDSALIYRTEGLPGNLFSTEGTAVSLIVETTPNLEKPPGDSLFASIQGKIRALQLSNVRMAGKVVAQSVFIDRMQQELAMFIAASIALLMVFLLIAFRTWWAVLVPLVLVLLTIIWTLGLMGFLDIRLDIMTTLLPSILFVVGISDVVHVVTRFTTALQNKHDRVTALRNTMREVALAKFATTVTTSVGFLSLMLVDIGPIATFGMITAVGVFIAYILSVTFLPAVLVFVPIPDRIVTSNKEFLWKKQLRKLFVLVLQNQKKVLAFCFAITVVSGFLISLIKIDATFLDDLSDDDPIIEDFRFFERHFAGVRPFEMHLSAAEGTTLFDLESLKEQEELEQHLRKLYGFQSFSSPVMIVKSMHKAMNGGQPDAFTLPETEAEMKRLQPRLRQLSKSPQFAQIIAADAKTARLSSKMPDIGSRNAMAIQEKLDAFIATETNPNVLHTSVTGSAYLLDRNNSYITFNLLRGLGLNVLVLTLIALLMFQTWRILPVAILPNLLPMVMIAGTIGLLGLNMKVSTAIIFTIAFGIAVDDTIHFLSKLSLEVRKRKTLSQALKASFLSTGKAIIITSCMLSAGFLTLLMSSFEGTFYIGLLISLTLVFALVADLLLLPVLALIFLRSRRRKLHRSLSESEFSELDN